MVLFTTFPNSGTSVSMDFIRVLSGHMCSEYKNEAKMWAKMRDALVIGVPNSAFGRRSNSSRHPIRFVCKTHVVDYWITRHSAPPVSVIAAEVALKATFRDVAGVFGLYRNPWDNAIARSHHECNSKSRAHRAQARCDKSKKEWRKYFLGEFLPKDTCMYLRWHHRRHCIFQALPLALHDYDDIYYGGERYIEDLAVLTGINDRHKINETVEYMKGSRIQRLPRAIVTTAKGSPVMAPMYLNEYTPDAIRKVGKAIDYYIEASEGLQCPAPIVDCVKAVQDIFNA